VPVPASADPWAIVLALAAIAMVFVLRLGMLPTLAISAALGLAVGMAGWL
jgi:chromate transporter